MTHTEVNAAFSKKVERGIFKPVERHLTNQSNAADRLQEAVALTWDMFRRYATQKGKVLSDPILVHSCRQRAVDLNRQLVPAGGGCRNQDVMDPRCYRDGKAELHRFDIAPEGDRSLEIAFAEAFEVRTERRMNSALDLEAWMSELGSTDQVMLEKRMAGQTLKEISTDMGMSMGTVDYRLKKLGGLLAGRMAS